MRTNMINKWILRATFEAPVERIWSVGTMLGASNMLYTLILCVSPFEHHINLLILSHLYNAGIRWKFHWFSSIAIQWIKHKHKIMSNYSIVNCRASLVPNIFLQHIICLYSNFVWDQQHVCVFCVFYVTNDRQFDDGHIHILYDRLYMYICMQRHNQYRILIHMLYIHVAVVSVICSPFDTNPHSHAHTNEFIYVNCTHVVYIQFSYWAAPYVNVDLFATCL